MPVTYRIDGRVVVVTCEGAYPPAELRQAWLDAEADPGYPERPLICLDMRRSASLVRRSIPQLREMTDWFIERAESVDKRCALVARPGVQYGLMRMASAWAEVKGIDAYIATRPEDAVAWLLGKAR